MTSSETSGGRHFRLPRLGSLRQLQVVVQLRHDENVSARRAILFFFSFERERVFVRNHSYASFGGMRRGREEQGAACRTSSSRRSAIFF